MLENIFKTLKTEAYVAHLEGGLRAISNPGSPVEIVPHLIDKASVNIDISSSYYKDIDFIDELKKLNLSILGLDYYNNIESIGQMYPPNWRTLSQINNLDNPIKLWDNLCIEGHTKQDYYLVDISSRISFGFKACETRLRDLSECYFRELYSQCQYRDFKNGRKFRSSNTFNIYLALHSFLVESCLVRDYLAEFMHVYIFNKYGKNPITTMGSLIKYVLK
ncbi:hypothetical protein GNF07_27955, partial (plasmid) [Trichormus variabilis FSR]|nr:hypothetical protein [Trichormus variabilis FSR]